MWYLGRCDNQIKRFGQRINLDYIEKVVVGATEVVSCYLVQTPVADRRLIHLFVVPAKNVINANVFKNQLKERLQVILPQAAQPDKIHVIVKLPMTSHGKVNKTELLMLLDDVDNDHPTEMPIAQVLSRMWLEFSNKFSDQQTKTFLKQVKQGGLKRTTMEILEMSHIDGPGISSVNANDTSSVRTNSKDTSFVNPNDTSFVNPNETSLVNSNDTSLVNLNDTSLVNPNDTSLVNSNDTSSVNLNDTSLVNSNDTSLVNLNDTSLVNPNDTSLVNSNDTSSVNPNDTSLVNSNDTSLVNPDTNLVNPDTSLVNPNTGSVNPNHTSLVNPKDMFILRGGDSFAAVQLTNAIEHWFCKRWGTNYDLSLLVDIIVNRTFDELVSYLEEKIRQMNPSAEPNFGYINESKGNQRPRSAAKRLKTDNDHVISSTIVEEEKPVQINPTSQPILKPKGEHCSCFSRRGSERFVCLTCQSNFNCLLSCPTIYCNSRNPQCSSQFNISVRWKTSLNKCIDASPLVVPSCLKKDGTVFVGSHANLIMSVSLLNGDVLWKTRLGGRVESSCCLSFCGQLIIVGKSCNLAIISLLLLSSAPPSLLFGTFCKHDGKDDALFAQTKEDE